jgi:hypothetical protein
LRYAGIRGKKSTSTGRFLLWSPVTVDIISDLDAFTLSSPSAATRSAQIFNKSAKMGPPLP